LYVVIATAGGRVALVDRTLSSLVQCRRPPGFSAIHVVENGPRAGIEAVAARFAADGVKYVHVPAANKSNALNETVRRIGSGLVYYTDDDVRFHPDTLLEIAAAAARHPEGAYFGGSVGVDYETAPPDWLRPYLPFSAIGFDVMDERARQRYPYFLGCNWAAYVEDVARAGWFDTTLGPGSDATGQETNMQQRLNAAGLRQIPVPSAMVWHYVPCERSSLEWAKKRMFKTGVHTGRLIDPAHRMRRTASAVAQIGKYSAGALALAIGRHSEKRRAVFLLSVSYRRGLLKGIWNATRAARASTVRRRSGRARAQESHPEHVTLQ
jgi:glycosyltransferase involved in cell wall biosynthesis